MGAHLELARLALLLYRAMPFAWQATHPLGRNMKECTMVYAVELENISKTFPGGVEANKDITLRIKEGEVHGLLGENGAGKSTLMNILYGLLSCDTGRIKIRGEEVHLTTPEDAIVKGVGMVHQHFKLVPPLTVTENVMMGSEPRDPEPDMRMRYGLIAISLIAILLAYLNMDIIGATVATVVYFVILVLAFEALGILKWIHLRFVAAQEKRTGRSAQFVGIFTSIFGYLRYAILNMTSIGFSEAKEKIKRIAEENGLTIDPEAKVADISVGLQQRVEIVKALYREAEILILDEPTSVLTPQEVDELFLTLNKFRDSGKTIILITHKLREPMALCDRISVLRDGELVGTVDKKDTSPEQLAQMMVGREVVFRVEKPPASPGDAVLHVEDLHVNDIRGVPAVKGISLDVRRGEIFGIAGVEGNGQTELVEALAGLRRPSRGRITVDGNDITRASPRRVREAGVAHIPEDRHRRGLVLPFTIKENLVIGRHYQKPFAEGAMLQNRPMAKVSRDLVDEYSIKIGGIDSLANTLSGGNQQKLVVARELSTSPKLILAAQPTRGLDVGATEFVHNTLIRMQQAGAGILLVSAELDEIRNLSDRIAVIYEGRIVAVKERDEATQEQLGLLMAGHGEDEEAIV